jgi:hypothetical protein
MKTNANKRDAIAQAMDWLGQLREDDRAEPTLGRDGEPAAAPATPMTAPPAPDTPPPAPVTAPPHPVTAPPAPAFAFFSAPPVPRVSGEDDPREGEDDPREGEDDPREGEDDPHESTAIAERAPIGDELRIPIAWCDMDACISYYEHPAALGEADVRARAIAAGWRVDAVGRLACPQCQQSVPWFWTTQPVVPWDRGRAVTAAARLAAAVRAETTGSAGGYAEPGMIPAVESPPARWPAERRDPEGSRGSDQAAGRRQYRA